MIVQSSGLVWLTPLRSPGLVRRGSPDPAETPDRRSPSSLLIGTEPIRTNGRGKRVVQLCLQNELANAILGGEFEEGSRITIDVLNGDFTFGSAV